MCAQGSYKVYIDASYVINGLQAKTKNYSKGNNGDIWTRIFADLDRIGDVEAIKVKSHVVNNEQWEKYDMTSEALCYNVGADAAVACVTGS